MTEEKTTEELVEKVEKLEDKVERLRTEDEESEYSKKSDQDISRRDFLRKTGIGAAGLGLASMIPSAAGLNIESSNPFNFNEDFKVDRQGNIDAGSIAADDATISNSITWPDGSTTTSPSAEDEVARGDYTAYIYKDENGDYHGHVVPTDTSFGPSSDAGQILQSVSDEIGQNALIDFSGRHAVGTIKFGRGVYNFKTPVTLDYEGTVIVGDGGNFQSGSQSATVLKANGLSPGTDMIRVNGTGFRMENLLLWGSALGIRNLHINGQDRFHLYNVMSREPANSTDGGNGLRVSGSYNSTISHCLIKNAYFRQQEDSNGNPVKNVNQLKVASSIFQTDTDGVPAIRFCNGGNWFHDCVFNAGDPGGGVGDNTAFPHPDNANAHRQRFTQCQFYGKQNHGNPMWPNIQSMEYIGCRFGGGAGNLFSGVSQSKFVGCTFATGHEAILTGDGTNTFDENIIVGCEVKANDISGNYAFDINGGGNDGNIIYGNVFRGSQSDYDMSLKKLSRRNLVAGNVTPNSIETGWDGGRIHGSGSGSLVVQNQGHNPNYTRSSPSVPGGTGPSNAHWHTQGQPALVTMSGEQSGTIIADNTSEDPANANQRTVPDYVDLIRVPPFHHVFFTNSTPNNWYWEWQS